MNKIEYLMDDDTIKTELKPEDSFHCIGIFFHSPLTPEQEKMFETKKSLDVVTKYISSLSEEKKAELFGKISKEPTNEIVVRRIP